MIGRTNHISWGATAALTDVSDLFRETISDDGKQYKLDGKWKDLEVKKHIIKIKD